MEIMLQIGVISRDNSEYCHYAIPENRAQDREKPRKISRIRAWGERGGLAHPKHRLVLDSSCAPVSAPSSPFLLPLLEQRREADLLVVMIACQCLLKTLFLHHHE